MRSRKKERLIPTRIESAKLGRSDWFFDMGFSFLLGRIGRNREMVGMRFMRDQMVFYT